MHFGSDQNSSHGDHIDNPDEMNTHTIFHTPLLFISILLFSLAGCSSNDNVETAAIGCQSCHEMTLDAQHDIGCVTCHQGTDQTSDKGLAHKGLIALPAHPDNVILNCAPCHEEITTHITESLHYTLQNSVNLFREAFGAASSLESFIDTPVVSTPETDIELSDDLLRRRCFRCHLYSGGDDYPAVSHGTGCSACHLDFSSGTLSSHQFRKPADSQCLSCHYGNYVGFDYYGRFEHDFNAEYRTPYTTKNEHFRPYGVEYHELIPDIHQQRKMSCIDCHSGDELMLKSGPKPSCKGCHQQEILKKSLPENVSETGNGFVLSSKDGNKHPLPVMTHPAHNNQKHKFSCQACHAQWTFNDFNKHLMRSDTDNYDIFENLSVQGSSDIETIVENNIDFDKNELPLVMTDKLTGVSRQGIWYKGFTIRRWEKVVLGRDDTGIITPVRPLLDYSLSWIDEDDSVRFDSISAKPVKGVLAPYVPHTTGTAGIFYNQRIQEFLESEHKPKSN